MITVDGFQGSRVYFAPCGIGLGHVSRCYPIAEELRRRGAEVMFSTYLEGVDYIKGRGLPVARAPAISLSNDPSGGIDLWATLSGRSAWTAAAFFNQVLVELRYMEAFKPDVVVSDTRVSAIYAARLLGVPVAVILNQFMPMVPRERESIVYRVLDGSILTILGSSWGLGDVILIPDFPKPHTISIDSLRIPERYRDKTRLVGAILSRKLGEVKDAYKLRDELGMGEGQRLIYAGISGPRPERVPLLGMLEPVFEDFPKEYRVIMSMGDPDGGSEPVHQGALIKVPWLRDRFRVLKACDMVISRGGHETLMQSIIYRKPSIIIPPPNHTEQYANARRAMELGVAKAMHQREVSRERLLGLISKVMGDVSYHAKLAEMNEDVSLGDGVENCIQAIGELFPR
jgi:UDP-N-acetylglucosamine--N-acetylmuramyl-(pentapeptide) pyrophosphoryl-undecaprenol N-acetylglucosamine transferase